MKRFRKFALVFVGVCVAAPLLFGLTMYASAWYYRWRAEQLLAAVKDIRPGVTTQTEYMLAVKPLEKHAEVVYVGDAVSYPDGLAVANRPMWTLWLPVPLLDRIEGLLIPPLVGFTVAPTFAGGRVSRLDIRESSVVAGHPPGAGVTLLAQAYERDDPDTLDPRFPGYAIDDVEDHERIILDERASVDQIAHALDLKFDCFTAMHFCANPGSFVSLYRTSKETQFLRVIYHGER